MLDLVIMYVPVYVNIYVYIYIYIDTQHVERLHVHISFNNVTDMCANV